MIIKTKRTRFSMVLLILFQNINVFFLDNELAGLLQNPEFFNILKNIK